jgi:SPP1 gp7 family putative phage head morphogenesis protein
VASIPDLWHSAILRNSLDLMRYDAHLRTEIIAMLKALGRDLVAELAAAELDTPRTDWQRARLRKLLEEAQRRIGQTYGDIADLHQTGMEGALDAQAGSLVAALNKAVGFELLSPVTWTAEQLATLAGDALVKGAPSADWWARQSVDLQNAFADQMRTGMLQGEGVGELSARVRDLQMISQRNAEALVRTSAMAVNNAAHMAAYQANSDIIKDLQWAATLDPRTCPSCGAQDGQVWPLGAGHTLPPLHWNCRCVTVPITKSWEELAARNKGLARELDQMEPGKRSSLGGPVSSDTTWESWLKGQSEKDQADILGPARLKLWRSGKLSLQDLVDQRGNALTLEQLRSR